MPWRVAKGSARMPRPSVVALSLALIGYAVTPPGQPAPSTAAPLATAPPPPFDLRVAPLPAVPAGAASP